MPSYVAQVPASTSNCGPGFDTLSVALSLFNFVRVEPTAQPGVEWAGPTPVSPGTIKMAEEAARLFSEQTGFALPGFRFEVWGDVPAARGLGSSATIRTGLLACFNEMTGGHLTRGKLVGLGTILDHAPDGISACLMGGFCVSRIDPESGQYRSTLRFDVPGSVGFAAVSPDIEVQTTRARAILPTTLPFGDVVKSLNSLAWMVAAFASQQYEALRDSVTDYVHQPARLRLTPYVEECVEAGRAAGAWAGWLSGSGSTVVCVGPAEHNRAVAQAMAQVYHRSGVGARFFTLRTHNEGLNVSVAD